MKKELMKLLGPNYAEDNGNITDRRVQGYDPKMNVAKVRESRKGLEVNRFNGTFYKPAEVVIFSGAEAAAKYILTGEKDV